MTLPSTQAFSDALNTDFMCKIDEEGNQLSLQLTEASSSSVSDADNFENLSLIFDCKVELAQQSLSLEHNTLGSLLLLIVPIGKKGDSYQYEALINREKNA